MQQSTTCFAKVVWQRQQQRCGPSCLKSVIGVLLLLFAVNKNNNKRMTFLNEFNLIRLLAQRGDELRSRAFKFRVRASN